MPQSGSDEMLHDFLLAKRPALESLNGIIEGKKPRLVQAGAFCCFYLLLRLLHHPLNGLGSGQMGCFGTEVRPDQRLDFRVRC